MLRFWLFILLILAWQSNAIVIRHDKKLTQYQVSNEQYPTVIDLDFLTGTLIDHQWILTAAHGTPYMPANQLIVISGQQYHVQYIVQHPEYNPLNLSHDIALLKLDRAVEGIKPTPLFSFSNEQGQMVWFVGKGDVGNGLEGIIGGTSEFHHAQNSVATIQPLWLTFTFNDPTKNALPLEGISGPGDSGGPAFIKVNHSFQLAGVSSHQRNNDNGEGLYGVEEFYTRVSTHLSWIESVMDSSNARLAEIAIKRNAYQKQPSTVLEKAQLVGRFQSTQGKVIEILPCDENLCYQWEESPQPVIIYKTSQNKWFTPKINRVFELIMALDESINSIHIVDFNGIQLFNRIDAKSVAKLKERISERGRELIHHVEPIWPAEAIENNINGSVTLSFSINTDGSVSDIKIIEATPDDIFNNVSIRALSKWRYASIDKPLHGIKTRFDFTP